MDPLSIASGAAGLAISCATILKTLYTWIEDTVEVDENVSNLLEEVSILSRVLDSVSNASGRVPQAVVAEIDPGNALWGSISATLDDIKNTFNKLNQLMNELEKTNRFNRGFLRKPTKQIKFSLRSKNITIYKDRIKSYNTAMTSAFQMINVNSSQDSVFKVLSGLQSQLRHVEVALHTSSSASPGPSSGREDDDRATQNLQQFVQVAKNFHSSASTILREGPRSTVWGGSIMGDPLTEAQTSMIERWIPPTVNEEPRSPVDADSDSETEFARRIEELAIKNEADGDHAKAEQFYRGAIEHGESSSRPGSDITAMKIRLAYACMRQEKWTEADEIMSPIAFGRKTNDILVYHGMHALALAYLMTPSLRKPKGVASVPFGARERFSQEYPPGQLYTTAASGPVPSAGRFQYPKTFGSQYTSPPTPNSHQVMVQYPPQHMQSRPNVEPSLNSHVSRKAIQHPDTMHRPQSLGLYPQQQAEQPRSTSLSYNHNSGLYRFPLLDAFDPHWGCHIGVGLRARGWNEDNIKENQQIIIDYFKLLPLSSRTGFYGYDTAANFPFNKSTSTAHARRCEYQGCVPSVIYYDLYQKVVGWGHDVANALGPDGHPKPGVQKVSGLPLLLAKETEESIPLPGIPPGLNAVDVSADFLYEVRRALRTQLEQRLGSKFLENEQRIHWILTSPEIWAVKDRTLWKRALQRAGYLRDESDARLSFIGEAEASIHNAISRYSLSQETQNPFIFAHFGKKIVHMSSCVLLQEPPFFASWFMSSKKLGPALIAQNFSEIAGTRVRRMRLPDGSRIANKVYTKCVSDFEERIMSDFRNNGQEWDIDVGLETEFPEAGIKGGYMIYTNDEILSCFQPVMDGITAMMAHIIGDTLVKSNSLIELKLPENLRHKVYPPMEPATQVVTGAAHLALSGYLTRGHRYVRVNGVLLAT
ncbi:hypothetical protein FPHYL_503 [Fusarium phyllophilum]|uniref:Fungal N-terminal domain-containing protein n=1 Tax=Fusarium phyllophilum TaxID=47803 RepID=A0A8H5NLW9_9HYPO|nr:hypothetical protein FPHYL_503 [Fusarium phyllophilum]